MSIQERYNDIVEISGLSETIIRRVLKATKQSLAKTLRQGDKATLPGICTIYPELNRRLNIGCQGHTPYIKLKAKASSALETEFNKLQSFDEEGNEINITDKLTYVDLDQSEVYARRSDKSGVRVSQLGSLM